MLVTCIECWIVVWFASSGLILERLGFELVVWLWLWRGLRPACLGGDVQPAYSIQHGCSVLDIIFLIVTCVDGS